MGADSLTAACELAFTVARQGRETVPPVAAPAAMRSFLWVAQLPPRAITVAQRVLNSDAEFRQRVASVATEAEVGRAGYVWLTRPAGWESEYAALTGTAAPVDHSSAAATPAPAPQAYEPAAQEPTIQAHEPTPRAYTPAPVAYEPPPAIGGHRPQAPIEPNVEENPAKAKLDAELANLRGLVDRLASEREQVSASAGQLESEVEERKAESTALGSQLAALRRDLAQARSERDAAIASAEDHQSDLANLQQQIDQLSRQVQAFEHERSLTTSSLSSAERQMSHARQEMATFQAERDDAVRQLDRAVAEREEAWAHLATLRGERDRLADRVRVAEQAKTDLEAELGNLGSQWAAVQDELDEVSVQRQAAERELERLQQARVTSVQDHETLFQRIIDQLGRVEAERNLLVAQLEKAQSRLRGTRSAIDQASRSLSEEISSTEEAFVDAMAAHRNLNSNLNLVDDSRKDLEALLSEARYEANVTSQAAPPATHVVADPTPVAPAFVATPPLDPEVFPEPTVIAEPVAEVPSYVDTLSEFDVVDSGAPSAWGSALSESTEAAAVFGADTVDEFATEYSTEFVAVDTEVDAYLPTDAGLDDFGSNDGMFGGGDAAASDKFDTTLGAPVDASDAFDTGSYELDETSVSSDVFVEHDEAFSADYSAATDYSASYGEVDEQALNLPDPQQPMSWPPSEASRPTPPPPPALAGRPPSPPVPPSLLGASPTPPVPPAIGGFPADPAIPEAPAVPTMPSVPNAAPAPPAPPQLDGQAPLAPSPAAVPSTSRRAQIAYSDAATHDAFRRAQETVAALDVVLMIDGDAVAEMGWPTLGVADRRAAVVDYLAELAATTGAAPDCFFSGAVAGEEAKPVNPVVRVRITTPAMPPALAMVEVMDRYPLEWPIAVVTDDSALTSEAVSKGAAILNNGQLLDLFLTP